MIPRNYYVKCLPWLCFLIFVSVNNVKADSMAAPWVGVSFSGGSCDGGHQAYGPYDYTNAKHRALNLPIVEEYHFTKDVQMLVKGNTGYLRDDLDYTLKAFPNHHKALNSIINYQLIYKYDIEKKRKDALNSPVECYLQRALRFSPNDIVSYMLYASYLKKTRHIPEAEAAYKKALGIAPDELAVKHSYGLFLFELKKYPEALEMAKAIYAKKYPKQKLKELLVKSGHWQK